MCTVVGLAEKKIRTRKPLLIYDTVLTLEKRSQPWRRGPWMLLMCIQNILAKSSIYDATGNTVHHIRNIISLLSFCVQYVSIGMF